MVTNLSLEKSKIRVLLLEGIHPCAVECLQDAGYKLIEQLTSSLSGDELKEKIADAHILGIRSRTQISAEILEAAKKLITIGCFCIGTNQVALGRAAQLGIPVFNAPHSNTRSVAELMIGQIIMLLRQIFPRSLACHRGEWIKSAQDCYEVRGKTLGIIGYGHIGSQVSVLAESMGMRVIYYDTLTKLPLGNAQQVKTLTDLLTRSDVVALHVPEDSSTNGLIGKAQFALMRNGACFLNASRGHTVDIDALKTALDTGKLKGAAIDVFPKEPKGDCEEFISPLRGMDSVILTPHIGGSTLEAQENIGLEVSQKLIYYSDRGSTEGAVNFPQVCLSAQENTHRLLHIHKNTPGMLQQINTILAAEKINVLGQHLQTSPEIGYVVLDIAKSTTPRLLEELKNIPGTIRSRVIY